MRGLKVVPPILKQNPFKQFVNMEESMTVKFILYTLVQNWH